MESFYRMLLFVSLMMLSINIGLVSFQLSFPTMPFLGANNALSPYLNFSDLNSEILSTRPAGCPIWIETSDCSVVQAKSSDSLSNVAGPSAEDIIDMLTFFTKLFWTSVTALYSVLVGIADLIEVGFGPLHLIASIGGAISFALISAGLLFMAMEVFRLFKPFG